MEVAPLRFTAGQHHTLTHYLLSGNCSELFKNTLCLVLLLVAGSVFSQTTAFITTWKTNNPGTSNSTSITIPTTGSGYLYDADWNNDGIFEQTGITGAVTHNFGVAGTYTVRIRGNFPRIFFNDGGDGQKLLNVNQWGTGAWTSMLSAFWGCSNLNITATDVPNLSGVTNTANMFASCTSLNGPANIGTWNMATVTDMRSMFHTASAFNQPIGTWNTGAVTLASTVFFNATALNQPIGTWNTAAMTTMAGMFSGATAFNQPLGTWTLNAAVNLTTMLNNCGMDCANYSATLIGWSNNPATPNSRSLGATGRKFETNAVAARTFLDVNKAWTITGDALTTAFFADADGDGFGNAAVSINACSAPSGFVSNSTDCNDANPNIKPGAIEICNGIDDDCNGTIDPGFTCMAPFITTWKTDNPGFFNSSTSITIPTTGTGYNYEVDWNNDGIYEQRGITGSVTHDFGVAGTYTIRLRGNFPNIFFNNGGGGGADCQKLLDISQWGGIAWTFMGGAFSGCSNLNISATDVPNLSGVTDMGQMFRNCTTLNGPANIGSWNTANVINMSNMFEDASSFNQPIGTWNTANVTLIDEMFSGASAFNQPIGSWNTAKVTNMSFMFQDANSFNQPIGTWNTANVTNMQFMFISADAFNQPIGNWNTAKVTRMSHMFQDAFSFNQPIGTWTLNAAVELTDLLDNCGMNCTNYSATLIGWSNNPATPNGRTLGAGGVIGARCKFETNAVAARTNLDITKAWTIIGDELVSPAFFADADGDGFGNAAVSINACSQPSGFVTNSTDCNDADANINPGMTEVACNGIDDNCNGPNDELFTLYADVDGDGFGNSAVAQIGCPPLSGFVINNGDCDDSDPTNNPNTTGFCSTMKYDEGDSEPGFAFSGWNFGSTSPGGIFPANASINGIETIAHSDQCWNAISVEVTRFCNFNNLNFCHTGTWRIHSNLDSVGVTFTILETTSATQVITLNFEHINTLFLKLIDPGSTNRHSLVWDNLKYKLPIYPTSFQDADGDGFGDPNVSQNTCSAGNGFVLNSSDCNDANANINPNATEICNGIDDDCDGQIDESGVQVPWFADADGDGFGNAAVSQIWCTPPPSSGFVLNSSDCDDTNANIHPNATEITCNGIDDNCNGPNDEQPTYFADADGDGFGNAAVSQNACSQPNGFVANSADCDDTNANIHPNATEIKCNGIDDNCNGPNDESFTFFADADGDGFGDAAVTQNACSAPSGFVANSTDCDDTNANIHPNATEVTCNGVDDNCNGSNDEETTYFADADGDGFGNAAISQNACAAPSGFVANSTDCDDTNVNIHPNAIEICNGMDDDCDGQMDENVQLTFFADADGDGFGNAAVSQNSCSQPSGFVSNSTDCDDTDANINPNATEICNEIDDDCDGQIDENLLFTFFADADGDGFGDATVSQSTCSQPSGFVSNSTDCNDANANANPNATEICNGMDDDCDGLIDENVQLTFFADADGDGFGDAAVSQNACSQPSGFVSNSTDCDDTDANINPNATEICNEIDDDCNGIVDDGTVCTEPFITTWKTDNPGTSNSSSITIPTTGSGYNYDVDWDNDGTFEETGLTGNVTHDFGAADTYTIRIRGTFPRIFFNNSGDRQKLLDISQWGDIAWTSMNSAFFGCSNLDITATDVPNLSGVTNMGQMFRNCSLLNGPANIGTWNTANVTIMNSMFNKAEAFNQPIGNWNTTNVTDMSFMFSEATSFNQPIGNWNTEKVTSMRAMFNEAEVFNQPIGNWNTAAVTNMSLMFSGIQSFNQPISSWNTEKVTDMTAMFQGTSSFNQPIGNWNTAAVTNMSFMFNFAIAFNQPIGNWSTAKVTNMRQMFHFALVFNQSLDTWGLNVVNDLLFMLTNCGMDCTNYSATLIGWNNNPATPNGRSLGASGRTYETNAEAARTNLIDVKGWTITGDALAPVTTAEAGPNEAICSLTTTLAGNTPVIGTGTWTQVSGPGTANFADANAPNTGVTASLPGTYTLRWTINAPCAASSDDVAITFAANPTANAGNNQTSNATCGLTQVTLAANTPSVGTGEWSIQSGTGGSFGDASSPTSTFSGAAGNTYTLRWTVTNAPCAASTDEMTVTFNQSPSFATCPPGVTVSVTSGCSATATYAAAAAATTPASTVTYLLGGATTGSGSGTGSGSNFNVGTTTVTVTATNPCGAPTCSFTVTVRDIQNPTITCPGNISKTTDANQCSAVTAYANPTFSDNCSGAYLTLTSVANTASNSAFPKGSTNVAWKATDAAGNSAVCSFTVTVTDGQPPSIVCPANIIRPTDAGQCGAIVAYANPTYSDNCPLDGPAGINHLMGGLSNSTFPKGTTAITWQATDGAGLTRTCSFTITVNDTQKPNITCPANQTRSTDLGLCSAVVTYPTPKGADNCGLPTGQPMWISGGTMPVASGANSIATFQKGINTVTWRATDGAGLTNTCTFRVTVNDTEAPALTCPAPMNLFTATNTCSAVANYTNPAFTDNCAPTTGTAVRISGLVSGSAFSLGNSNVVFQATDAAGNTRRCTMVVTVTDNQLPVITCPAPVVVNGTGSPCAATVFYGSTTASDNCADTLTPFLVTGLSSGSQFPAGVTTNTFRAVAPNGQSSECTFSVTVNCGSGMGNTGLEDRRQDLNAQITTTQKTNLGLTLAPNPAAYAVTVSIEGLGANGGTLLVFDQIGRLVQQQVVAGDQRASTLQVAEFAPGLYRICLKTDAGMVTKTLVVVKE